MSRQEGRRENKAKEVATGHCHTLASVTEGGLGFHTQAPLTTHPFTTLPIQGTAPVPVSVLAAGLQNRNDYCSASPTESSHPHKLS